MCSENHVGVKKLNVIGGDNVVPHVNRLSSPKDAPLNRLLFCVRNKPTKTDYTIISGIQREESINLRLRHIDVTVECVVNQDEVPTKTGLLKRKCF